MIEAEGLTKIFQVHKRSAGLLASVRSLFSRAYHEVRAVDGVTFSIAEGERVGFLGPNGAGKTTTLKMLSGLLHPSAGTVTVDGFVPKRRDPEMLKRITLVMGQRQQLIWDLPAADTFALNAAVYGIPKRQFAETLAELDDLLDMKDSIRKPVRQLSLGERMKCELAAALLHRPKVLFLDEPTIGLDVTVQFSVRAFIKSYNERFRATVLLTSHYMEDVLALCPRVIVIDRGRMIFDGELDQLVRKVRPEKRISLKLSRPIDIADGAALGEVVEHEPGRLVLRVSPESLQTVVGAAMSRLPVEDLTVENPPLEEVMRDLFQRSRAPRLP